MIDSTFRPARPSRGSRTPSKRASKGAGRGHLVNDDHLVSSESGLEHKAALALLADPRVAGLVEQPPAVAYVDPDGTARSYTFDFLVRRVDGTLAAFEVKPRHRREQAEERIGLVRRQAGDFADTYHVLTDEHLGRVTVHDATLVYDMRRLADPAADGAVAAIVSTLQGTTTVTAIVAKSGLGPAGFGAVVRAVGDGSLVRVDPNRLSYSSRLRRAIPAAEREVSS